MILAALLNQSTHGFLAELISILSIREGARDIRTLIQRTRNQS